MARIGYMIRRYPFYVLYHIILISLVLTFMIKYRAVSVTLAKTRERRQTRHSASEEDIVDYKALPLDEGSADARVGGHPQPPKTGEGMAVDGLRRAISSENKRVLLERGDSHRNASSGSEKGQPHLAVMIEAEGRPDDANQSVTEHAEGKTNRKNVLIVAAMRTGSSFLGELFNQRKDFFYMFEPGMQIMHKLDSLNLTRRVIYTKLIDMLDEFYACNFDSVPFFVEELKNMTLTARKNAIPALVSLQFCRPRRRRQRPKDACDEPSVEILERACSSRNHTAIKSIRVLDINLMISAVTDPNRDLKLIHLVRDPRSMILSRLKLKFPTIKVFNVTELSSTYKDILYRYCSNWLQNYEIGRYVPLMRQNYLMVRYEDLALEPYVYAKKIYDFIGLGAEIPQNVKSWIDTNTNTSDRRKLKVAAFSTKRDSKSVLVSWKSRLTLEMARAIEGIGDCTALMKATGYKLIGDDQQMLDNTDHLVDVVPAPEFDIKDFEFM